MIRELNERSQAILKYIVDAYMETGVPVGSRTVAERLGFDLSPATIRGIMADLENAGLLHAPHTSAGRLPTQQGLRFYIDGLMQVGTLSAEDRVRIETQCRGVAGQAVETLYEKAGAVLSGLSSAAAVVAAPKADKPLRQVQFVRIDRGRVLVILVTQDGLVENRVMAAQGDVTEAMLASASNYLSSRVAGRTLAEARREIMAEIASNRASLDALAAALVEQGLALAPSAGAHMGGYLVVRGQSRLLDDVKAMEDLEKARLLLAALEEQETIARLVEATRDADGIEIFIGTENRIFEHAGWSMVIAPYRTPENRIVGAVGVIGPTRLNYSRIIPIVDYTVKVMEKLL